MNASCPTCACGGLGTCPACRRIRAVVAAEATPPARPRGGFGPATGVRSLTAADLCPDMHLRGLVLREVAGELVAEIPVVKRARRRCRRGRVRRIDVTWTNGCRCCYAPGARLEVLEAA